MTVTLATGVTLAFAAPRRALVEQFVPRRFAEVEPGRLYRSGQIAPRLLAGVLREHRIGVVVDLTGSQPGDRRFQAAARAEAETLAELGVRHVRTPLHGDGTGDPASYVVALEELARARQAGIPALVHCDAGMRRSAGVIAAYERIVEGRSPEEARRELGRFLDEEELRASPLPGWLEAHLEEIRAGLRARRVPLAAAFARAPLPGD